MTRASRLDGLLRWLVRLYPAEIRDAHGEEMLDFVRQEKRNRRSRSAGWWALYLSCCFDIVRGAARSRWRRKWTTSSPRALVKHRRDLRGLFADALRELWVSLRSVGQAPLAAAAIVMTLAIAIGMNTAIFSVVHGVLLEPFPYAAPEQLVYVGARWTEDDVEHALHTGHDFTLFKESLRSFEDVAALTTIRQNLTGRDFPSQVEVGWASRNFFRLLGVETRLGPGFTEDAPPGTLVLSDHLFQEMFGGDEAVVGSTLDLDGRTYTVAGILPHDFELHFPSLPPRVDLWKVPDDWWQNGDFWNETGTSFALLRVIGRLGPSATLADARHELSALASVMRESSVEHARIGLELSADSLHGSVVGGVRPVLWLLLGAAGVVLVVACANVTNLLLVRVHRREKELTVRRALGASRASIVRLLLLDSAIYATAGGAVGIGIGYGGIRLLGLLRPDALPRWENVALDGTVLGFAVVLAVAATFAAGLLPAWKLAGASFSVRAIDAPRRHAINGMIVVAQIGASMVPLIGASLLATSLSHLSRVAPGFDPDELMTFSVSLPGTSYERPNGTDQFLTRLTDRLKSVPGLDAASIVWPLPLGQARWLGQYTAGDVSQDARAYAQYSLVSPDIFETLRVPIVSGRSFSRADPRHVVVISENLAERAFPGRSALGRFLAASPWGAESVPFEVIGIVRDVRYADLREPPPETIYFDSRGWSWTDWEVNVVVRGAATLGNLVPQLREELAALDPSIPLSQPRMLRGYVDDQLARNRLAVSLAGVFALMAAALALVGLYGVISFTTGERSREIGIRMALGAARTRVMTGVLRRAMSLTAVGIGLGLAGSWFLTQAIETLLFEVTATDPATFAVVAGVLAGVAMLASYLPARRATRIEPVRVLRAE